MSISEIGIINPQNIINAESGDFESQVKNLNMNAAYNLTNSDLAEIYSQGKVESYQNIEESKTAVLFPLAIYAPAIAKVITGLTATDVALGVGLGASALLVTKNNSGSSGFEAWTQSPPNITFPKAKENSSVIGTDGKDLSNEKQSRGVSALDTSGNNPGFKGEEVGISMNKMDMFAYNNDDNSDGISIDGIDSLWIPLKTNDGVNHDVNLAGKDADGFVAAPDIAEIVGVENGDVGYIGYDGYEDNRRNLEKTLVNSPVGYMGAHPKEQENSIDMQELTKGTDRGSETFWQMERRFARDRE